MAVGIVCEFNPLHNGHLYLINKVKEKYDEDIIVVAVIVHLGYSPAKRCKRLRGRKS